MQVDDLNNPAYYNNRELSWLAFNKRVLEEAIDNQNPLLERLKFLSIFSSNLDEFFMVRVAGLKDQVKAGFNKPENKAGLTPKEQLVKISTINHELVEMQYNTLIDKLLPELEQEKIRFVKMEELDSKVDHYIEKVFDEQIFPVLTPMAVDAYHPFPMLLNKSLNLAILLRKKDQDEYETYHIAIVQVPAVLDRFIELSAVEGERQIIFLEDVIAHFIHKLFKGLEVISVSQFRITRNADLTIHEEGARDLLKEIEKELKKRKWGAAVRLEVQKNSMDKEILNFLLKELEIHEKDVYWINGPLDLTFLGKFYNKMADGNEHLVYGALIPQPSKDLNDNEDMFDVIAQKDVLLHHPYESFQSVVDFVTKASEDSDVLAIKQTLYRVSGDSPIIKSLKNAAEKGKQVTVLVELKARFDEENNVQWAKELEKAGCHVIYGMTHLKTHSKITLIVRRKQGRIERFVHLGTGNYNDITANFYTDMGLLTANRKFGIDATNFFNYLSGYSKKPVFEHLAISPFDVGEKFIELINQEILYHQQYGNGRIIAKMNSVTHKPIIQKLYEASRAGVQIDLIVRGICCLRPGIKGVSENIRVRSIVARYLEHTRVFYFYHNGEQKTYLSSADWMTRNIERRVEILFPIFDPVIKGKIKRDLGIILSDNVKAREQDEQGSYHYVNREKGERVINSQMELFYLTYQVSEDEE
ncbi:RNA degradosome polyphosphate kinase [Bacillus taeanensis]|uniref:Polyphosphate kinase n=1 Tax=Bacillus taeanensis TaxID=273032 RepID=A0A366XT24_9BACI|nr:RNA degradosome polyphosphate kinase [Bacillus taeanensis]